MDYGIVINESEHHLRYYAIAFGLLPLGEGMSFIFLLAMG